MTSAEERSESGAGPQQACNCCKAEVPGDGASASRRVRGQLSLLPALALLLLPKCPLCFAAWFGVMSSLGATAWLHSMWGTLLVASLLTFSLGAIGVRAWRLRSAPPFLLACTGALLLYYGKAVVAGRGLEFAGFSMLAAASIWNSWGTIPPRARPLPSRMTGVRSEP
jgi:hypothetical protein